MARISANGLEFEYDETGPKEGVPVVLIMGFGAQMTAWPDIFRLVQNKSKVWVWVFVANPCRRLKFQAPKFQFPIYNTFAWTLLFM